MARIERIRLRLENWALWKMRESGGGLGYHSINVLASDVWSRGSYNGMHIPHIDAEAAETDAAVQAMQLVKSHLYVTLQCIYIKGWGVQATARRMARAPSTIHAQLEQSDRWIEQWLRAQIIKREQRGRQMGSFTP